MRIRSIVCHCGVVRDYSLHKDGWKVSTCRNCGDGGEVNDRGYITPLRGVEGRSPRDSSRYRGITSYAEGCDWDYRKNNFMEMPEIIGPPSVEKQTTEEKGVILMLGESIVLVKFNNGGDSYSYLTDLKLAVGDKVVVDVNGKYECVTVVKVKGLSTSQLSRGSKYIVQKVDVEAYEGLKEKRELSREIRNKLRQRKEEMEDILVYKTLSESDPEIKKLLGELSKIDPNAIPQLDSGNDKNK